MTSPESPDAGASGDRTGGKTDGGSPPTVKLVVSTTDESGRTVASSVRKLGGRGGGGRGTGGLDRGAPGSALSGRLTAGTIERDLRAGDRDSAIRAIVGMLARTGKVADPDALVAAVLAREAEGTTGLGGESALPHARTDAVTEPVAGFARSAAGVDWGSADGTPARLIFLVGVPEAAAGDEHLRLLAALSGRLADPDFRSRLLRAPTDGEVLRVLAEIE
ncbi:PTS sugar transporter subunit IIA [Streptomyces sp. NPDC051940]|uniref:PTS sugar transporter subunit IIA n=1 Tax=Streptomyces sp. NPDC051940 TaxID=3155675 RepID=UPI00344A91C7